MHMASAGYRIREKRQRHSGHVCIQQLISCSKVFITNGNVNYIPYTCGHKFFDAFQGEVPVGRDPLFDSLLNVFIAQPKEFRGLAPLWKKIP